MTKSTLNPQTDLLQHIADNLTDGIYAITGISKNAGKTSFLNQLIPYITNKSLGIMTTGRDGETTDAVFGNLKPTVKLPANVYFTTVSAVLEVQGSTLQIISKLPFQAGTRQLWLAKTMRETEVEITGAATAAAQISVAHMMQEAGVRIVLIDGSLDRKSVALSPEVKGLFLVAGSSFGNLDKIRSEVERLYLLSRLKEYSRGFGTDFAQYIMYQSGNEWKSTGLTSLMEQEQAFVEMLSEQKPSAIYLPGALTDSVFQKIKPALDNVQTIVIRHPLQLHIQLTLLNSLLKAHDIFTLTKMNILCLALNSWSVKGEHQDSALLRSQMRSLLPDLQVVDIREGWNNDKDQPIGERFDR